MIFMCLHIHTCIAHTYGAWRRQWHPLQYSCLEDPMGGGAWVACSSWGHKELDTTEQFHFHFSLSCTGEGNGNPLQCSCLENPRDGRTWWATIYGVIQSWTQLKRLSSSSSSSSVVPRLCMGGTGNVNDLTKYPNLGFWIPSGTKTPWRNDWFQGWGRKRWTWKTLLCQKVWKYFRNNGDLSECIFFFSSVWFSVPCKDNC